MSTATTVSWTNAAESLLVDLASESIGTSLPLDATQEKLNMSRPLVYMAGLIVVVAAGGDEASSPPPFTKEHKSQFQRLQTLYHEGSRQHETLYELSPTLLPCESARKEIQQAVKQRAKEIEEQSAKVARELSLEAEVLKAKNTKKSKTTTKKKETTQSQSTRTSSPEKEDDALKEDDEHMVPPPCSPESQSLSALFLRQLQSITSDEDNADESGSWMEVTKKSKKLVVALAASPSVEESKSFEDEDKDEEEDNIQPSYYVAPSLPTLEAVELAASARMKVAKKPLLPLQHVEEKVESKKEPPETNKTERSASPLALRLVHTPTEYTVNDPTDTLQQWQAKIIRQLESQLSQKNQEYQEERTAHAKALALEKELSNERLQSLQLRLYISETRLKTFEDALEQHVQAVANNTAPTSPERRRLRRPEDQATSTTTPLLARVQEMNREG